MAAEEPYGRSLNIARKADLSSTLIPVLGTWHMLAAALAIISSTRLPFSRFRYAAKSFEGAGGTVMLVSLRTRPWQSGPEATCF
jgi:hypothetical protein